MDVSENAVSENVWPDELNWLAFRYISGEMLPVEIERFEERLATEQWAREAVAAEVRRSQAVVQVLAAMQSETEIENEIVVPDRAQWSRVQRSELQRVDGSFAVPAPHLRKRDHHIAGWIGAAIAASLAFALILHFAPAHRVDDAQSTSVAAASNGTLATIWAESELAADRQDEWHDGAGRGVELARSSSTLDDASDLNVPEWMLAAVSVQAKPDQQPEDRLEKN